MAITFSCYFFLKIGDFLVGNNILWDAPDHTISVKKFPGEHAPGPPPPPSNSVPTQFYRVTNTSAMLLSF